MRRRWSVFQKLFRCLRLLCKNSRNTAERPQDKIFAGPVALKFFDDKKY
jgi:hypothetical protein